MSDVFVKSVHYRTPDWSKYMRDRTILDKQILEYESGDKSSESEY